MSWDSRYDTEEYVYGTAANEFLASVEPRLPRGLALCLAEGEGRNAVFLAGKGFDVVAVDSSAVGLAKARTLAEASGVSIRAEVADLADFEIEPDSYDLVVSIFCHLPPSVRRPLLAKVVRGLKPGGAFVLEGYTPEQLKLKTGGPPSIELLLRLDELRQELSGLRFEHAVETRRNVIEGKLHTGVGAVVQILAFKP